MKEERTAVHLDGTGQQTAEVVDVPTEEETTWATGWKIRVVARKQYKTEGERVVRVTCSEMAVEKKRLCPHKTSSWPRWWAPGLLCGHKNTFLQWTWEVCCEIHWAAIWFVFFDKSFYAPFERFPTHTGIFPVLCLCKDAHYPADILL